MTWIGIALGLVACGAITPLLGCHNPTGYCGKNVPDPDRIGGPSWFLWVASPQERLDYYSGRCLKNDPSQSAQTVKACALQAISQNAHHYCVSYFRPPASSLTDAQKAKRDREYQTCKGDVLDQHGL